jgi:hypothetical protein
MVAGGVAGGSAPTSTFGTSSRIGANIQANQSSATKSGIASPISALLTGRRRIRGKNEFPLPVTRAIDLPSV